ncbi:hypothetical protein J6590_082258 [Homalodisca vitripennis]|nr:hypothetical protein J6590_082258 [Homalodisca vitripennis]
MRQNSGIIDQYNSHLSQALYPLKHFITWSGILIKQRAPQNLNINSRGITSLIVLLQVFNRRRCE